MDMITIYCGKCGEELKAKVVDAGAVMRCDKCRVRIPIPSSNLGRAQIRVFCPKCGSRLRAWPDEAGKEVECRRCKKVISLPDIKEKDEADREPKSRKKGRKKGAHKDLYTLGDEEDEIEKEEVKVEPVKKRRAGDVPVLSFTDHEVEDADTKKAAKSKRKDEDDEEMISFDEFLVDDVTEPKKKKRRSSRKDDEKTRKAKLSAEERRRAARDTDALPPSQAGKKRAAPRPTSKKTLVVECEECAMRLVFKDGRKPLPNATCPACGEKLAL